MDTSGTIHQNEATLAGGDDGAERMQGDGERTRVVGCLPSRERSRSDLIDRYRRAFCLSALARRRVSDARRSIEKPGYDHGVGDLDTAIVAQRLFDSSIVSPFDEGQAAFIFGDPAYLLAPSIFMLEIGYTAILADQRVHDVGVLTPALHVEDARALVVAKPELCFIVAEEGTDDLARVRCVRRRIDMDMMDRTVRATVRSIGNDLGDLPPEVFGCETARWHDEHPLPILHRQ